MVRLTVPALSPAVTAADSAACLAAVLLITAVCDTTVAPDPNGNTNANDNGSEQPIPDPGVLLRLANLTDVARSVGQAGAAAVTVNSGLWYMGT